MSEHTCQVRSCDAEVRDAFVCTACTQRLVGDLRRIISGHQSNATVRDVGTVEDYYAVGQPGHHQVRTGTREGAPVVVDAIRPGDFARNLSSPFDHNGGLLADLAASYSRETRTGRGGASAETPLVWHEKAGELRMRLCATLVRHARLVATVRNVSLPDDAEPLTVATWLLRHVPWLRHQQAGAAAVTEIHTAVAEILRIIDPVADRTYAGPCNRPPLDAGDCTCDCHTRNAGGRPLCDQPKTCEAIHGDEWCGRDLYARDDVDEVVCPDCKTRWRVPERRDWLLRAARDVLGTATEIARALTRLEQPCTPERIRKWRERGRLLVRGRLLRDGTQLEDLGDDEGLPLYRLGDVEVLLIEASAAAARRDARKAG